MTLLGFFLVPPILAIIAFHMVRPNTRRLLVSMSAHLEDPPASRAPRVKFSLSRPITSLRFWVRVLLALIALAAIWQNFKVPAFGREAVTSVRFVLDLSPSMDVRDAAGTRRLDLALAEVQRASDWVAREAVVLDEEICVDVALAAGAGAPRLVPLAAFDLEMAEIGREGMAPSRLLDALSLTSERGCPSAGKAVVFTDLPQTSLGTDIGLENSLWVQVGAPVFNAGIEAVEVTGGGLGGQDATLHMRAAVYGERPDNPSVSIIGPFGTTTVDLSPDPGREGGWTAQLETPEPGDYTFELLDGGAYPGDDRVAISVAALDRVSVDWQLTGFPKPAALEQVNGTGLLVVSLDQLGDDLPDRSFVAVYAGFDPRSGRQIGPFLDHHPLLNGINLDAFETFAPSHAPGALAATSNMDAVMRGGAPGALPEPWIMARDFPPSAIIPFDPFSDAQSRSLSFQLLANALRFASGLEQERLLPLRYVSADGRAITNPVFEAQTARPLAERPDVAAVSLSSPPEKVLDDVENEASLVPWLLLIVLALACVERVIGLHWSRTARP